MKSSASLLPQIVPHVYLGRTLAFEGLRMSRFRLEESQMKDTARVDIRAIRGDEEGHDEHF